jgi:5-formyltetrahydrofolate cyclo-ligase
MEMKERTLSFRDLKVRIRKEIWEMMRGKGLSPAPYGTIPTFPGQNKAAERLRRLQVYKNARTIMVPPDQAQLQVRINTLLDSKRLIMATPGLRDGFYLFEIGEVKIKNLVMAVRSSGVKRFGKRLATTQRDIGEIDLLITGAVAVGLQGGRIGKGSGYFDLEYMILQEIGSVKESTQIVALVDDLQVLEEVPMEEKDVSMDFIVTPTRFIKVETDIQRPTKIIWERMDEKRIRRMRPLRELRKINEGKD